MTGKSPDERDSIAHEVDRLLKKLPGAETKLAGAGASWAGGSHPARSGGGVESSPTTRRDVIITWVKLAVGAVLGVLMTQYPYVHDCGVMLYGYLGAVLAVAVAGGSAAMAAWRHRMAVAHLLSLIVIFWTLVLAAEQILPRIGYAAVPATWTCPVGPAGGTPP